MRRLTRISAHDKPEPTYTTIARFNVNVLGWIFLAAATLCSLLIRKTVVRFHSADYQIFLRKWYEHLSTYGFSGFRTEFADYNFPYLYLLWAGARAGIPPLALVKGISIFFDLVLAAAIMFLFRSLHSSPLIAAGAGVLTLLMPNGWLNSAVWGQCDIIYTSFLVLCVTMLIRRQFSWSWFWFGVAFSFKLQAVFLLPLLGVLWLIDRRQHWWAPAWAVVPPVLAPLPAVAAGRPLASAFGAYVGQGSQFFTTNAPNFMSWFGPNAKIIGHASLWLALGIIFFILAAVVKIHCGQLDTNTILRLSAFVLLAIPFLLPTMRGRYFFSGEIFLLIWVMKNRWRNWWLLLLIYVPLTFDYARNLFHSTFPLGSKELSVSILVGLALLLRETTAPIHKS
ncbi:hypothetical protein [Cutibacterium namnetense]|uniref:hypothetical protein n=1 Tax=Cutibacterium namnetense TaxID=1574624 RepID=UPI000D55C8F3|nr:hypothetical protein [Cutibacterium namnetense]